MTAIATARNAARPTTPTSARLALGAATLGFLVITLDAVVVNVALPSIRAGLGGGIVGLQWVVDGYTLLFAALLLSSGSLTNRVGARRAFGLGMTLFVAASIACGAAPSLALLVTARFVQGAAAAVIMPATLSLISQAYPDKAQRARAVALWALGGSVASTSGPLVGGSLAVTDWRLIFFINVPLGAIALYVLNRTGPSTRRQVPFDWWGQITAIAAMGSLTYAAIEGGSVGFAALRVVVASGIAVASVVTFVAAQARVVHPMVPLELFSSRTFRIALSTGFAFMVGGYGLPFVFSLYLQGERHLSALQTGVTFLPMMLIGLALTPFSARIVERVGARCVICLGLTAMAAGLAVLALLPVTTPLWVLAASMVLVGLCGPLTMPPMTAVLLNHIAPHQTGVASGVFNTARQIGGALAVAVFGALLANSASFASGMRSSLLISAAVGLGAALASVRLAHPASGRRSAV